MLLGWAEEGGHRLHPLFWRGWASRMLFCIPGSPIALTVGFSHSSIPQNTHPSPGMRTPKGFLGPSHLSPFTGVTPGNQNTHRSAGKAINYSTTFINTGIFTVHSLLVAVTMENGGVGGKRGITTRKKKLKEKTE